MRDPDLVVRAQRAATELERAWDRWRTQHGLGSDPLPPISSYVGYSLEEPWGQPRVVFGIDAREAEQLAALLDRLDLAGPIYAAVASMPGTRTREDYNGRQAEGDRGGRVRVPTQAHGGSAQRETVTESAPADALLGPLEPPGPQGKDQPAPLAAIETEEPSGDHEGQLVREDQGSGGEQSGLVAFRPRHEPAPYQDEGAEPDPLLLDEPGQQPEASRASASWTRASRVPGGHALPRQKRSGAAKPSSGKQEGKDRAGLEAMAAELAGWAAGELPGQASHRCAPGPMGWQDRLTFG